MSSNSPSGGMNDIDLSFSNLDNLTHWWNLTSSMSTALLLPLPVFWNSILSLSPSLSSGIPDKYTRIFTDPTISDLKTLPFADTSRFTDSITSKNTSFFLYVKPSDRQLTDPTISDLKTLPFADTSRFTDSITSKNTSF